MDEAGSDFDLLAASLRADLRDLEVYLEVLAAKLNDALPGATAVEHEGGLLSRKRVRKVRLDLGEHRYELARAKGRLEGRHSHSVRGITLKTEVLAVEDWIEQVAGRLAEQARGSSQARSALGRLLGN